MIFKSKKYEDFVETKTYGRVYFKPLTNGILQKVEEKSTIKGSLFNNSLFFGLMEKELCVLPKRKYRNLAVSDGNKIRQKLKEILLRENVIQEEVKPSVNILEGFNKKDIEWFEAQKQRIEAK
jgi:hypothetical protein